MIHFTTRSAARAFKSKKSTYKLIDNGSDFAGKRWSVKVL